MLLLPVFRGEYKRLLLIGVSVCIYLVFRRLAVWANHQRPSDWKTVLAEKKRLSWGPEEFARALTQGRASNGSRLAVFVAPGEHVPQTDLFSPQYEPLTTLLRVTAKQRFPRALKPIDLLKRDGVSAEECEALAKTLLYVHPEIADRAKSVIED
jgi:hypothetical protein